MKNKKKSVVLTVHVSARGINGEHLANAVNSDSTGVRVSLFGLDDQFSARRLSPAISCGDSAAFKVSAKAAAFKGDPATVAYNLEVMLRGEYCDLDGFTYKVIEALAA